MEFPEMLEKIKPKINWKVTTFSETSYIYRQLKETYFEQVSQTRARMEVRNVFRLTTPSTVNSLVKALIEDEERLFDDTLFLSSRQKTVGFINGVFDLLTGTMRPYRSSDFICNPLPHEIQQDVEPSAEKFLMHTLEQWVGEEAAGWFADLLGYILFVYPNREDVWCNFFGQGANGKSICLGMLEKILGDAKTIGCDLKNINRFSGDAFKDKWLVIGRDSSPTVSDSATSFIKTFTGDRKLLVERKGGDSFDVPNTGKLIVSTNHLIQSKDRSYGWYRRLIPIPFPNTFKKNDKFEEKVYSLIPAITRVLLNRAYMYLKSETAIFASVPKPVQDLIRETRMLNDRVTAFWEGYFFTELDAGRTSLDWNVMAFVHGKTMSDVFDCYRIWHEGEFGELEIEPSLKTFGGPYGAFLSGPAGKYFFYKRDHYGRRVEVKPDFLSCLPKSREQDREEKEVF